MIKRLRNRFIRIATLSVLLVMVFLTLVVNTANFFSTNSELNDTLELIYENQGTIPSDLGKKDGAPHSGNPSPNKNTDDGAVNDGASSDNPQNENNVSEKQDNKGKQFTQETPYSTRYFVLRINSDGSVDSSNLDHIVSVTSDDIEDYAADALECGEGFSYCNSYKLYLVKQGPDRYMAIFLDCYKELRAVRNFAIWSVAADIICIALVYLLVTLFSRKAIDPTVRAAAKQKQFITDATHELKTPLTVINTSLSVLEMEIGQQKWVDKAKDQTSKMALLINELITLSKLDEEDLNLNKTDFCISDAVKEIAEPFQDAAEQNGYSFSADIAPEIRFTGEEVSIRRLVSILLDNALKYTTPNGKISLSLRKKHRAIIIEQMNSCETMDKENLSRLFDRFYRPDSSRSSDTGGFGIGLSIAKSIAESHGGTIKAECPYENQICFTVTFRD